MALCSSFMVYAAYLLCLIGQVSADGLLCCTISDDKAVKIYDVINYDMMAMLKLTFHPKAVEWVFKQGDARAKLAMSRSYRNTFIWVQCRS
jgi:hypothetical protein